MTIASWIERHAAFQADRTAILFGDRRLTYGELDHRVRSLARGLRRIGVGRGERVAFLGYNHPDLLVLLFACARLGAMLVPLNWRLAPLEHERILRDAAPRLLVAGRAFGAAASSLAATTAAALVGPDEGLASLLVDGPDDPLPANLFGAPLLLVYTSGTTGQPKGAVLTQSALFWNALNSLNMHDMTAADRVLSVLPLFHVGGLNIQTVPALYAGAEVLLLERFEPAAVLAAIRTWRPSLTVQVPATTQALAGHPDWPATDVGCLRMVATGSSIVPLPILEAWHRRGVPSPQVYGATETAPIAVYQRPADALRAPGSAGRVALHGELRIVDPAGSDLPAGRPGELWVRGPQVMRGYWNDPAATAAVLTEGWFHTGDIGCRDAAGDVWIIDRMKDVIISGGENIYPAEVEAVLLAAPAIVEATVVGASDPRWGEVPVAVVVRRDPSLDATAVLALFADRLARFKQPREVQFWEALPRNAMGKVRKDEVRRRLRPA